MHTHTGLPPAHSVASPWLEPPGGLPPGTNYAELGMFARRLGDGVYDTNLSKPVFYGAMERAAKHAGYIARHRRFKAYYANDEVLELAKEGAKVSRRRLKAVLDLPGAPMFACLYERELTTFSTFCCGQRPHDVRYVSKVSLRAHQRAKLVFETYQNDVGNIVRRIYVELDLDPKGLSDDMPTLRRTVENTVHAVFLGIRPKRRMPCNA